jgi:hypothetical protein
MIICSETIIIYYIDYKCGIIFRCQNGYRKTKIFDFYRLFISSKKIGQEAQGVFY